VVCDGTVYAAPKGRKAWALLAYLALSDRLPTRQQLVDLLFPDADDPAGALRWNLSELRRLLGGPDTIGSGNVVQLRLPEGSLIEVQVLMAGTSLEAVELPAWGGNCSRVSRSRPAQGSRHGSWASVDDSRGSAKQCSGKALCGPSRRGMLGRRSTWPPVWSPRLRSMRTRTPC
jgi:hypothetical protein